MKKLNITFHFEVPDDDENIVIFTRDIIDQIWDEYHELRYKLNSYDITNTSLIYSHTILDKEDD